MSADTISTPCVQVCVVDPMSGLCIGCGRTAAEIAGWGAMSEADRIFAMAALEDRLIAMRSRGARGNRARARRRNG